MSNFINLLDIVYPVASIYLSVANTSPSEIIGGTWEKIEYGMLACAGDDSNASVGDHGGSKTISVSQMPRHSHTVDETDKGIFYNRRSSKELQYAEGGVSRISYGYFVTSSVGGGRNTFLPITASMFGSVLLKEGDA